MRHRFMRLLVFFDLPMESNLDKKEYRKFRDFLIKSGFIMMQKSVYYKLLMNPIILESIKGSVKRHLPPSGLVQMLAVTEKQFASIEYILGDKQNDIEDSDKRLIEL